MVASRFIGVRAVWGQIGRMARPREGSSLGTKRPSPPSCCAASWGLGGGPAAGDQRSGTEGAVLSWKTGEKSSGWSGAAWGV